MVLDERALKAFVLVAQTGSMSKAAERLSVSVSTISRLLGKVESMAGTDLSLVEAVQNFQCRAFIFDGSS